MIDLKYKERKPEETIKLLKNFFKSLNFDLKYEESISEAQTYSCFIKMLYNNNYILTANGKGLTKELSLASGLGELYERFCNKIKFYTKTNMFLKIIELNKEKYNFYLDSNEKIMSYDEFLSEEKISNWFNVISNQNISYKNKIINAIANDIFIGVPYQNIINNEIKYLDPRFIYRIMNSTGLCAGHSFQEAFCEGFSEILERYVLIDLISSHGLKKYYIIDNKSLSQNLKNRINLIEKYGSKKYYLVDLSYNYGFPVIMGILIDKRNFSSRINFGCYPVFEIAAERTITEMYQNISKFDQSNDILFMPTNKNFFGDLYLLDHKSGLSNSSYIPPYFFENQETISHYNSHIFLDTKYTLNKVYEYYKNIIQKYNLHVWVKDNSQIKQITALSIYVDNLKDYYPITAFNFKDINYDRLFSQIKVEQKYTKMICSKEEIKTQNIDYADFLLLQNNSIDDELFSIILYNNSIYPLPILIWPTSTILPDLLNFNDDFLLRKYADTFLFYSIKKFFIAKRCFDFGYSFIETQNILNELGIKNFSNIDYNELNNFNYIIQKALLEPSQKYFHSKKYEKLILEINAKYEL